MDSFYAFLIFAVILALELFARQTWLAAYFRFGIPVYITRRKFAGSAEPEALAGKLQERFKDRPGHPTLRFKLLSRAGQSRAAVAFQEALFEARSVPRYFPVMHSLAELDPARGEVRVTGWLNGYVVFLLVYLVVNSIADRGFVFVALLVAALFGLSYAAQAGVNHAVVEEIRAGRE